MIVMTEYAVICVVDSTDPDRIHHVGLYTKGSESITHLRSTVIANIDAGHVYYTWFSENGKWKKGALVQKTSNGKFITTDPNNTTKDNLGNLPDCRK